MNDQHDNAQTDKEMLRKLECGEQSFGGMVICNLLKGHIGPHEDRDPRTGRVVRQWWR